MMNWNSHMTSGGWIFSILATVVVLSLVIAAGVWIAHELHNRWQLQAPPETRASLDERPRARGRE
jgi:hypothetical protein